MASTTRLVKSFYRLLLPIFVLLVLATLVASIWLAYNLAEPPKTSYLMTPEKYGLLSTRGAKVTGIRALPSSHKRGDHSDGIGLHCLAMKGERWD